MGTDAGGYVRAIAAGRYEEAYRIARQPNPFASICGRICSAPCEVECRRAALDESVSIRALKRFVCERFGVESEPLVPLTPGEATSTGGGRRVAVVGAGPAGLACAHDLVLLGHRVTVLEAAERPGGMLTLGIPEYRLPRAIVEAEIAAILGLGVELTTGRRLGADFVLQDLFDRGFEAVFLAIGAHRSRRLSVVGAELDGVLPAIDYLLNQHLGYRVELGQRIVVVGGGNVALDAARSAIRHGDDPARLSEAELRQTLLEAREVFRRMESVAGPASGDEMQVALDAARQALRAGAREVDVYCLESLEEMPASRLEIEEALEEGVRLHPRYGPQRVLGEGGRVTGVEMVRVERVFDSAGRFNPLYVEGSQTLISADTVVLAIGQSPDLSWRRPEDRLEATPRGTLVCDPDSLVTTNERVFAGGDAAFGPRNVIHAVAEGRRAARSIHLALGGAESLPRERYRATILPARRIEEGFLREARQEALTLPISRRIGVSEVEQVYAEPTARREALRCLECHISPVFDGDLCVACGGCVDVCPEYCLSLVDVARLARRGDLGHLLEARYGGPPGSRRFAAMLKDETLCIRCGLCAERCPVGAVTMERVEVMTI